jgi:translation elongation factor EF-Tu-like GTPase
VATGKIERGVINLGSDVEIIGTKAIKSSCTVLKCTINIWIQLKLVKMLVCCYGG